jgi:lipopolysaccharide transport system ATP-binding protein
MSSIHVAGLGKAYKQYPTRWSRLAEWMLPGARERHRLVWVLRDVSFAVEAGEAVGIVGQNGAGKSTLLKIIVGTTQATTGQVAKSGRVAALLELGMGFHPEFTGRQNVAMAGQLIGLSLRELERLMPSIESFAEVGQYIDQPVRVYSSGMMVRLAFSVATATQPDVLIVDEALAVGDAYFQHKSFERIRELRRAGTTLLMVTHDAAAVRSICDRALLLDAGRLVKEGRPEQVLDFYNGMVSERERAGVTQRALESGRVQTVSGTGEVTIADIALMDAEGRPVDGVEVGEAVTLALTVKVREAVPELVVGYVIKDRLGQPVFGTNTYHLGRLLHGLKSGETIGFRFDFGANLGPGTYSIAVALHTGPSHVSRNYEWRDLALLFSVGAPRHGTFEGVAWLPPKLEIAR